MESFSFSPPLNSVGEGKWLLAVTSFETTNSVFNITNKNNSLSLSIPVRWRNPKFLPEVVLDKLKNLLKLRSPKDIELHVEEVKNEQIRY